MSHQWIALNTASGFHYYLDSPCTRLNHLLSSCIIRTLGFKKPIALKLWLHYENNLTLLLSYGPWLNSQTKKYKLYYYYFRDIKSLINLRAYVFLHSLHSFKSLSLLYLSVFSTFPYGTLSTIGLDEYLVFGVNAPVFSCEIFNPHYSGYTWPFGPKLEVHHSRLSLSSVHYSKYFMNFSIFLCCISSIHVSLTPHNY